MELLYSFPVQPPGLREPRHWSQLWDCSFHSLIPSTVLFFCPSGLLQSSPPQPTLSTSIPQAAPGATAFISVHRCWSHTSKGQGWGWRFVAEGTPPHLQITHPHPWIMAIPLSPADPQSSLHQPPILTYLILGNHFEPTQLPPILILISLYLARKTMLHNWLDALRVYFIFCLNLPVPLADRLDTYAVKEGDVYACN